jgi:hypothetical protein
MFCVIVIFICESIVRGEEKLLGICNCSFVVMIFIWGGGIIGGEDRLHGIWSMFVCDCNTYLKEQCPW